MPKTDFLSQLLNLLLLTTKAIEATTTGQVAAGAEAGEYLLQIVQAGNTAYQQQVGQPINPDLLQPVVLESAD